MRRLAFLFVCGAAWAADTTTIEMIVAKVNTDIVTRTDLARTRQQMIADATARGAKGPDLQSLVKEHEPDLLRDRIDELLLVQRGKDLNINVDNEVSKYLAQLQLDNKISDPEKFQAIIREQSGMSYEDFRADVKNNILRQRVIGQEVYGKMNVSREEVAKYYDAHKSEFVREEHVFLREILISTEGKDAAGVAAAEKKAKDVDARAKKGEKFFELARDNSDSATAKQGGDIGAFKKGDLYKEIEDEIWDKPKGYITDVLKRPNGFLILRVDDHIRAGQATMEEVENEIKEKIGSPIINQKIREYLTSLRTDAFLEIREGYVDTGAAPGKSTKWSDPAQLKPQETTKEAVANQTRKKKFLWVVPIPGTKTVDSGKSTSK
jgi:peptidyl-prolyl cis-trans isomerase SurA